MPFIIILFDVASFICFANTIGKKPQTQTQQMMWHFTRTEVKKRMLSERKYFPKKQPEQMIFSLLHGVLVQATPINDNGS